MLLNGLLLMVCLPCFLKELSTTCPGMAPPTRAEPSLINQ